MIENKDSWFDFDFDLTNLAIPLNICWSNINIEIRVLCFSFTFWLPEFFKIFPPLSPEKELQELNEWLDDQMEFYHARRKAINAMEPKE